MAFEGFKARIALLLDEASARPEDAHELQERVREQLAEMRALGMPLPGDLVELERSLQAELAAPPGRRSRRQTSASKADEPPP